MVELLEEWEADWLTMLELPQFEEKKKREVVVHQLRIVLVDKLMLRSSDG